MKVKKAKVESGDAFSIAKAGILITLMFTRTWKDVDVECFDGWLLVLQ